MTTFYNPTRAFSGAIRVSDFAPFTIPSTRGISMADYVLDFRAAAEPQPVSRAPEIDPCPDVTREEPRQQS